MNNMKALAVNLVTGFRAMQAADSSPGDQRLQLWETPMTAEDGRVYRVQVREINPDHTTPEAPHPRH